MPTQDQIGRRHGGPLGAMHERLADVIGRWTAGKENCSTSIKDLAFFRREVPNEPCACLVEPSIVLVVQGAKQLLIGDRAYAYNTERFLITSFDLPATSQVLEASPDRPCLGLVLRLDLRVIAELIAQSKLPPPRDRAAHVFGTDAIQTSIDYELCHFLYLCHTQRPSMLVSTNRTARLLSAPDCAEASRACTHAASPALLDNWRDCLRIWVS